ncbi:MAG: hypothetical protein FWB96_07120 [Defluviitaleaceae bacterium]|nr:hypothetical protein [Defluviitaleaceae bacterium]
MKLPRLIVFVLVLAGCAGGYQPAATAQIVYTRQESVHAAAERLFSMATDAIAAGASGWGQPGDGITVFLDPYTPEQKEIFTDFLLENEFNPEIFTIEPAVTPQMVQHRLNRAATAAASPSTQIIPVGVVDVSQTGIGFSLENTTDEDFLYGSPWDVARYENGTWIPVPHLPGAGGRPWTDEGYTLLAHEINHYRISFDTFFDPLPHGRYIFIRQGWNGNWPHNTRIYAVVEFEISDDTAVGLP